MTRPMLVLLAASLVFVLGFFGSDEPESPRELGHVEWPRDFDGALARSAESGKPVFAFFQEVPGCQTCVNFGEQVLEHPLLVEAIESEFEAVLVYNNKRGRDAEILARFGEPSWNNPIVRFLDGSGRDLIPRKSGVWSPFAVARRMVAAIEAADRAVPAYLALALDELTPRHTETAVFGMYCYWSGEACLGELPGVRASRTGYTSGGEVVEITFDPAVIDYATLVRRARDAGCATRVFARNTRQLAAAQASFGDAAHLDRSAIRSAKDRDQKYYLKRSRLRDRALTPRQATRVNAAIARGDDPSPLLSPRQRSGRSGALAGPGPGGSPGR